MTEIIKTTAPTVRASAVTPYMGRSSKAAFTIGSRMHRTTRAMMIKVNILAILLAFLCASHATFGQGVRVDIPILTGGPNVPVTGGALPQALFIANATVSICQHPAATIGECTPATTYTDATLNTTCLSSAQMVQLPGTTCTASAGTIGNIGFWYGGGLIDYFVVSVYGTFGPYSTSAGSAIPGPAVYTNVTSTQTLIGPLVGPSLTGTITNGFTNTAQLTGSDVCAQASSAASGVSLILGPGQYNCSNQMVLATNTQLICAGADGFNRTSIRACSITSTFAGDEFVLSGGNRISGVALVIGSSSTSGLKFIGDGSTFDHSSITGGSTGGKLVWLTSNLAFPGLIEGSRVEDIDAIGYLGTFLYIDRSVNVVLANILSSADPTNRATSHPMVIDSGTSGILATNVDFDNTGNPVIVQHTISGGWLPPNFFFFTQMVIDSASVSDCMLFDSSLGTDTLHAGFIDSWWAGCTGNGIHISGGIGIDFDGGTVRANGLNGVLIDAASPGYYSFRGMRIVGNNSSNSSDAHGIYVSSSASGNMEIVGNTITGGGTLNELGHQKYGIKIFGGALSNITSNNLANNDTGPLSLNSVSSTLQYLANIADTAVPNHWVNGFDTTFVTFNHAGTTTLSPVSSGGNFTVQLPAADGILPVISGASSTGLVCWKTAGGLGTCSAGTFPSCSSCN